MAGCLSFRQPQSTFLLKLPLKHAVSQFNLVHDCINVLWHALLVIIYFCLLYLYFPVAESWCSSLLHILVVALYDIFSCNCAVTMLRM